MARPYVPAVARALIAALYHEAKHRGIPMNHLLDRLLRESLMGTPGWRTAQEEWPELATNNRQDQSSG